MTCSCLIMLAYINGKIYRLPCNYKTLCFICRSPLSWDTDIAHLAGQEISVELKDRITLPKSTSISHNYVSSLRISLNNLEYFGTQVRTPKK